MPHPTAFPRLTQLVAGVFILLCCALAHAQTPATGTLSGRVSNQATNQYLNEAEIVLDGTSYRTLTDRDGSYSLPQIKPGTYTSLGQLRRARFAEAHRRDRLRSDGHPGFRAHRRHLQAQHLCCRQ